jgi:hypothetical protein
VPLGERRARNGERPPAPLGERLAPALRGERHPSLAKRRSASGPRLMWPGLAGICALFALGGNVFIFLKEKCILNTFECALTRFSVHFLCIFRAQS